MPDLSIVVSVANLAVLCGIVLGRKYLFSYMNEKGRNLATREDVAEITRLAEAVKIGYVGEIERLKAELALLSRKHGILFDEKVRVFKLLQARLVAFKKFCEASAGAYSSRGEFHPHLDSLDPSIDKASLRHLTVLHELEQEHFIFLSGESRRALGELRRGCAIMCSMELAILDNAGDASIVGNAAEVYDSAIERIDRCLESLYTELEFPTK
jgi:hypothetical protein